MYIVAYPVVDRVFKEAERILELNEFIHDHNYTTPELQGADARAHGAWKRGSDVNAPHISLVVNKQQEKYEQQQQTWTTTWTYYLNMLSSAIHWNTQWSLLDIRHFVHGPCKAL